MTAIAKSAKTRPAAKKSCDWEEPAIYSFDCSGAKLNPSKHNKNIVRIFFIFFLTPPPINGNKFYPHKTIFLSC